MKNIRESKEPWKKQEPGARLSKKAVKNLEIIEKQRRLTAKNLTQNVRVYCNKNLFLLPGLFKNFTIILTVPMREQEFLKRIAVAFPELKLEES